MDANTPVRPSTPDGNPIQDKVEPQAPMVGGPQASGPSTRPAAVEAPGRPRGPNASAIVVGLVAMVIAGLIIARETLDWQVNWSRLGPGGIVGIGVVMVVIGAVGLVRRHDDV
jgi:hypothetical protein